LKDIEIAAYEKSRKKKDPDLDRNTLKPRLPDEFLRRIVKAKINSPACMNKGFILDGFPRNASDASGVFLEAMPEEETAREKELPDHPGFRVSDKIVPQYVVMFEAEDAFLKASAKEIATRPNRQDNHNEAQTDKRLKIYRESNPSVADPKHLLAFFQSVIGEPACMSKILQPATEEKTKEQDEQETLDAIQAFCE